MSGIKGPLCLNLSGQQSPQTPGKVRSLLRVEVTVCEMASSYEFTVVDHGVGIAPEYHQRIWGIFQRLEARDKLEGTGIGLAVLNFTEPEP